MDSSLPPAGFGTSPRNSIRFSPWIPRGAPWGPKTAFVTDRLLAAAHLATQRGAKAIVVPCNTATVTAIDTPRERFDPHIPVLGTVPAVKPAAATRQNLAVWATVRTTASDYQDRLIADFANGMPVARAACPGLGSDRPR